MRFHKSSLSILLFTSSTFVLAGCGESADKNAGRDGRKFSSDAISDLRPGGPKSPAAKPKTTDHIGEFNPDDGKQVVDSKVQISNPITGALEAYQPLKEQVAGLGIDHALNLFNATEGRFPKDHDEFMSRIIKENHIRLPVLGTGKSYEYDVANHKLVIVMDQPANP